MWYRVGRGASGGALFDTIPSGADIAPGAARTFYVIRNETETVKYIFGRPLAPKFARLIWDYEATHGKEQLYAHSLAL
jgi:hypothetical protein